MRKDKCRECLSVKAQAIAAAASAASGDTTSVLSIKEESSTSSSSSSDSASAAVTISTVVPAKKRRKTKASVNLEPPTAAPQSEATSVDLDFFIGKSVVKQFPDFGANHGTVVSREDRIFRVRFSNDQEEKLELDQLEPLLMQSVMI